MHKFSTLVLLGVSAVALGCGGSGDDGAADREELDSGVSDTGHDDSDNPDADISDSGDADSSEPEDAEVPDDGDADSGEPEDAEVPDGDVCPEDLLACDGACIDPLSDILHCGACDFACPSGGENTVPVCAGGTCAVNCAQGYGDCDDDMVSCETAIAESDPNNCGGCGIRCEATEICVVDRCNHRPPTVLMASPEADATDVRMDAKLTLSFSIAVTLNGDWFTLSCSKSGERGALDVTVTGDELERVLTPNTPFLPQESCTLRVHAAQVEDADDDANTMESDYVVSFTTAPASSVLLHEDFQAGMPADWKLFDVDGRPRTNNVSYVDKAWIVRDDFKFNSPNFYNLAAFSTSDYQPPGTSNDWMMTRALALPRWGACRLSWMAVTYDPDYRDGYEVRISTTDATPAGGLSNPPLVTIPAENAAWTERSVSLEAYAGSTVFLAFRNVSNDKFLLLVDEIDVRCQQ